MSDRLNELQRLRALAQEQVAWLDREIAREQGAAPVPPTTPVIVPPPAAPSPAAAPAAAISPAAVDQHAEEILQRYKPERPLHNDVRRGCFVYFFIALALVGIAVLALYAWHVSRVE